MNDYTDTYNVRTTVTATEFVNASTDSWDECVTIVPERENRRVVFLRLVESLAEGADENVRIATEIPGTLAERGEGRFENGVDSITLHGPEADTVLTFLRSYGAADARGETGFAAEYWPQNDTPALESAGVHTESLFLTYTVGERTETVAVNHAYTTPAHMNARRATA